MSCLCTELERMEELHKVMELFAKLHADLTTPLPGLTTQIKSVVGVIDTKRCLKTFTSKGVEQFGKPPPIDAFTDGLPCNAQALEEYPQDKLATLLNSDVSLQHLPLSLSPSLPPSFFLW
jgi:hypothetical protein